MANKLEDRIQANKPDRADLEVFRNNNDFLKYSHIKNRLISELTYVRFDIEKDHIKNIYNKLYTNRKDTTEIASTIDQLLSINCMDISIPGKGLNVVEQNIFNIIKSHPSGLDNSSKNLIQFRIIESASFDLSLFLNNYFHSSNDYNGGYIKCYPNDLKFNVYVFPLKYKNDGSAIEINSQEGVIVAENCMFRSFDDWDFDLSGNKSDIQLKNVSASFEKLYLTNGKGQ